MGDWLDSFYVVRTDPLEVPWRSALRSMMTKMDMPPMKQQQQRKLDPGEQQVTSLRKYMTIFLNVELSKSTKLSGYDIQGTMSTRTSDKF